MEDTIVSTDIDAFMQSADNAAARANLDLTAVFSLEPTRATDVSFSDLGFVSQLSENSGKTGFNAFPFDSLTSDLNGSDTCNISVWDAGAPEDAGTGFPDKKYYWIPDTAGAAVDLRYYELGSGLTDFQESYGFLSPSQSFAISAGAKTLTQTYRGDYYIPQGATNFVKVAELNLEAGVSYELDYDVACFYSQGGPGFSPEFVLGDAGAGLSLQLLIESTNETTMIDDNTADMWTRAGWVTRSWDVDAATNWNSTYTKFNTIGSELAFFRGAAYSIRYKVKATLTCTETTTCDLRYYNTSGAVGALVDVLSFRVRAS